MSSSPLATVDQGAVQQADRPSGKRRLILIASSVALLAAIALGLWLSGLLHHVGSSSRAQVSTVAEKPTLVDVPDIVTNLDNGSRRAVFIKLKAKIEIAHSKDQPSIVADMPRILDAFQTYLRSLRPEELHGGEGMYRLREAMMNRMNVISAPVQILDVLFVELLVQ